MITSPYNFVPLSDKVVMPHWAKHVSHDMPFENGLSGTLQLKMTAHSPIYVRNGVTHNIDKKDYEAKRFNHFNDEYFIPATSIKGMLRSVTEIMSFGRMANKVDDNRYSVRDFQNSNIYDIADISKNIRCGWLKKVNGEYKLQDCDVPARLSHKIIQAYFNNGMSDFFALQANQNTNTKSAKFKIEQFPFEKIHHFSAFIDKVGRTQCEFDENGKEGTIVMTGQPGYRYYNEKKKPEPGMDGKALEFVFWKTNKAFEEVSETAIKNFFFAYHDHDKNQQKEDWKWRKPQLEQGEAIPIFFRKEGNKIIDIGLSYLYKITYKKSIKESIDNTQKNADNYDLAETIFGYTEKQDALKGRVNISHAFLQNTAQVLDEKREVLSSPKASYYPNYVEQSDKNGVVSKYNTFMDSTAKVRGWKRYPIRANGVVPSLIPEKSSDKILTKFIPLKEGAIFSFSISYHNLREEELGALVSAITFHNTTGLFHSIGMGKPLGYGKIAIEIERLSDESKNAYLKAYETYMNYALNNAAPSWAQSPQLKELFMMSKGFQNADENLKYMALNDFVAKKRRGQNYALQKFSSIANQTVNVTSLIDTDDLAKAKQEYQKEIEYVEKYANQASVKENIKSHIIAKQKQVLIDALEVKKQTLLAQIEATQAAQKIKEQEEDRLKKEKEQEESRLKKENKALEGSQMDLIFDSDDYKKIADVVKTHIKKYKLLTETQKKQFKSALAKSYQATKIVKNSIWAKNGDKINAFPWNSDIKTWIGEEDTKVLFQELTKI